MHKAAATSQQISNKVQMTHGEHTPDETVDESICFGAAAGRWRLSATAEYSRRPPAALILWEAWKHSGTPEHPLTQNSVSNANLELKLYEEQPRPEPELWWHLGK
jgi:hypothetical protein